MKYQITVSFECSTEDLAILAFQNAVEKIAWADGTKFRTAALLAMGDKEPILDIQTLGPEDFSNWERRVKSNEEVVAYDRLISRPGLVLEHIIQRLYNTPYRNQFESTGVIAALNVVEELHFNFYGTKKVGS